MIDMSLLPAPEAVETLDFETIFTARKARFLELVEPENRVAAARTLELESEPIVKLLQESAYRELILRQRINEAAHACMLAYSGKSNLEHLAVLYGVQRLVVDPGDPNADIPIAPTYESDTALRARVQMAPESFSTAGPTGAYEAHARAASGLIVDAKAETGVPGEVIVTILCRAGQMPDGLTQAVAQQLGVEKTRPLNDHVSVRFADLVDYAVEVQVQREDGPSFQASLAATEKAIAAYAESCFCLGGTVDLLGLSAAVKSAGIRRGKLISPDADVACQSKQAPHCISIKVVPVDD